MSTEGLTPTTTGQGTEELAMTVALEPGDSAWLMVILQGIAANGAVVDAELVTRLKITED